MDSIGSVNSEVKLVNFLSDLSNKNTSDQSDNDIMQRILRRLEFHRAFVIYGVVYLEGRGTRSAPPTSIHAIAKMILKMLGDPIK